MLMGEIVQLHETNVFRWRNAFRLDMIWSEHPPID